MPAHVIAHDLPPAAELQTAPHRYTWDDASPDPLTLKDARLSAPYRKGDVVFADIHGEMRRCYVHYVGASFNNYGDPREFYVVLPERKDGRFGTRSARIYPGHVQRGYQMAGWASDIPVDA